MPDDPPPGDCGSDRDGAKFLMGCGHWTPAREGQVPAVIPPPTVVSRQDPTTCDVCGTEVLPGCVCGGCLMDPQKDGRLMGELVRDHAHAAARAEREAAEKGPRDFAGRKHARAARAARKAKA